MARKKIRSIGILTSGGDCQGLNAAIRAVAKTAMKSYGMDVVGAWTASAAWWRTARSGSPTPTSPTS